MLASSAPRATPPIGPTPLSLTIVPPLAPPSGVKAADAPEGVKLTWSAPGEPHFRIFRLPRRDRNPRRSAKATFPNTSTRIPNTAKPTATPYTGVNGAAESDAVARSRDYDERHLPARRAHRAHRHARRQQRRTCLGSQHGAGFQGLPRVPLRRQRPLRTLADDLPGPSYSDKSVQSGKHYRYTVSASDQAGNASPQSAPVEIAAP